MTNVRDYGAMGNGVTDDADAFGRAVDACLLTEEKTLLVPPGNYLLRSPLYTKGCRIINGGKVYVDRAPPLRD